MADALAMLPLFFAHATRGGGMRTVYVGPSAGAYLVDTADADFHGPETRAALGRIYEEWGRELARALRCAGLDR